MGQPAGQVARLRQPGDLLAAGARLAAGGVWDRLHQVLLAELRRTGQLDFSRCSLDSVSVRAKRAGELTGANPVDRGKRGSKYHLLVERGGVPLAAAVSAANTPEAQLLERVVDAVPAVKGRRGRPRRRPAKLHTDKAYDSTTSRRALRRRGIIPRISRRGPAGCRKPRPCP